MPTANAEGHSSPARAARVVIADNLQMIRAGLRSFLSTAEDLEIVGEAATGLETIRLCSHLKPDLALIDVRLAGMDGVAAAGAIRRASPETHVIVMAAQERTDYLIAAIRAGAAGYLPKSATPCQLLAAIRGVLCGESVVQSGLLVSLIGQITRRPDTQVDVRAASVLTGREVEIVRLIAAGKSNGEIALALGIALRTVKSHVEHIIAKLRVADRTQAAVRASELGLLDRTGREESRSHFRA